MRLAYVAALAVSVYSSNERTKKPFNPHPRRDLGDGAAGD